MQTNYQFFLASILLIFLFSNCKNNNVGLPASYYNFEIDSTVQIIHTLPSKVNESSGIILIDNKLWTHNDSGDDPILYQVSMDDAKLLKKVTIKNATAKDWEDIAQDSQYVYVGDFGNNRGNRQDLAIYRIPKSDLLNEDKTAEAFKLNFTYPDRTDFNPGIYNHNFDCEAFISIDGIIYLFSKNHVNKKTRLYELSNQKAEQIAVLKSKFDSKGMITGAAYDPERNTLALSGYNLDANAKNFGPFVWLFWDFKGRDFFSGKSKRVNMPFITQMEGICFWKDGQFLLSTEKTSIMKGKVMVIDARRWVD